MSVLMNNVEASEPIETSVEPPPPQIDLIVEQGPVHFQPMQFHPQLIQQQHQHADLRLLTDPIRLELLKQFEYYFSAKNLLTDTYLLSQMDPEAYVPVNLIAQFKRIRQLTSDLDLILSTIRLSSQLQLDPITNTKVRSIGGHAGGLITITSTKKLVTKPPYDPLKKPIDTAIQTAAVGISAASPQQLQQQRCVLIMREVASGASLEQIKELFLGKEPHCPAADKCESAGNDSWYITFANEEDAQRALQYLKADVQTFMEKPIRARIKAHSHAAVIPRSSPAANPSMSPMPSPHTGSVAAYPVINRIISESPHTSHSPTSASPQLTELNVTPTNAQIYPNHQYLVQTPSMSPSSYQKNFIHHPLPPQTHPTLSLVDQHPPSTTTSINEPPLFTHQPPQSQQQQQHHQHTVYPYAGSHPQSLIQMQMSVSGAYSNQNAQAVAQAAAVQAYYHTLAQSPAQQYPSQPSLLVSASNSSLNASSQQQASHVPYNPASSSSNAATGQYMLQPGQFTNQTGYYLPAPPPPPPASSSTSSSNSSGKDANTNTPAKSTIPTTPSSSSSVASSSSSSNSTNQVTSPATSAYASSNNPGSPYLIANMNGMNLNTLNAAYQYYHAYNTAINNGYQQHAGQAFQPGPPPLHFYELAQQPESQSATGSAPDAKSTSTEHLVYTNYQQQQQPQPPPASHSQIINSNVGSGSPQLLITTIGGQQQQTPQYQMNAVSFSHNHHTPPPPTATTTSTQQHFSTNQQQQRRANTTSLTEQRYHPHHTNSYQFNNNNNNSNNRNNNYFNRKFNNHNNSANNTNLNDPNAVPASGQSALLSPGQSHHYYNYNQYNQSLNNTHLNNANPPYYYTPNHTNNNKNYYNNTGHTNNNPGASTASSNNNNSNNSGILSGQVNPNNPSNTSLHKNDETKNDLGDKEAGVKLVEESAAKQTKSPPINCDLVSFPPLLNAHPNQVQHHLQHQQQQQPVNSKNPSAHASRVSGEDSVSASVQLDPAIISISNSANSIPTTPTIVTSSPSLVNGSNPNKTGKKQHQGNLNKILASATPHDSPENPAVPSQPAHHHSKTVSNPNRPGNSSNPDHFTQKQHAAYQNSHHHPNNHYNNNKSAGGGGGGYTRKSIDSLHFSNNNGPNQRGAHQAQKYYQNQNPRNNYANSRQQHGNSNSAGHASSLNSSTDNTSSGCVSQTGSPSSSNSSRQNNKKPNQTAATTTMSTAVTPSDKSARTSETASTNSDDEQGSQNGGVWASNKKLTFAEILQKKQQSSGQQQPDSSISSSSQNVSSASSQATTPTTSNPTRSFPLALSTGQMANIYNSNNSESDNNSFELSAKIVIESEMILAQNKNSSIPV